MRLLAPALALLLSGCFLEGEYPGLYDPAAETDADGDGSFASEDCDDSDPAVFPGADEACDGVDTDCSGAPTADLRGETDDDLDGFLSCEECDDDQPAMFPGNPEVCDGLDNDCDAATSFSDASGDEADADDDGFVTCEPFVDNGAGIGDGDCDDDARAVFPGADEACNAVDDDCDTQTDEGFDSDGDGVTVCGPDGDITATADNDCDDEDIQDFPGAVETCNADDENCDGVVDDGFNVDGDAYTTCGPDGDLTTLADNDCDDTDPDDFPGAQEACNADDEDCDGTIDEGFDVDNDGFTSCGADGNTATTADNDCDDADPLDFPGGTETCNADDEDCDGTIDEGFDTDGDGVTTCGPDGNAALTADNDCDDGDPLDFPGGVETCNGDDEDCDGTVDNGFDGDSDGVTTCGPDGNPATTADNDCDDSDPLDFPGGIETCNADDENCDGVLDDGFDADTDTVTTCGPDGVAGTADDDCDDGDITAFPGATEVCDADLEDCGGTIDAGFDVDGDLVTTCGADGVAGTADDDCDDGEITTFPGATELCDGNDNDCDGDANAAAAGVPFIDYTLDHSATSANVAFGPLPLNSGFCGAGSGGSAFTVLPTALDASFTFEFYGEAPNFWSWTADGAVDLLGSGGIGAFGFHAQVMPSSAAPNGFVAVWNANLDASAYTHCWGMSGTSGNLVWYYDYEGDYENPPGPAPPSVRTQVQFHQFDNAIEVHYISAPPPPPGNPVSVGVENQTGSTATTFANVSTSVAATGEAIRFEPVAFPEVDHDSDGQLGCQDCNDLQATVFVGASEVCGDGLDNDCNGQVDDTCP